MSTRKTDEQGAFEAWFVEKRGYAELETDEDGQYSNRLTHWAWEAWQASKARQAAHAVTRRGTHRQLLAALLVVFGGLVAGATDMV